MIEIIGETDGITDTRKVIIPIREYNALLAVAEAAQHYTQSNELDDFNELYEALDELERDT